MVCWKSHSHFLLVFKYTWLWLWLWWTSCIHVIAAYHSLKLGDTLSSTSQLCSENYKYCMGFSPFASNNTYLHIYAKGDGDWSMWIGNRNQPVDKDSAVLTLNHSGQLKLESNNTKPIILYSSPQSSNNNIVATLLDTGNFVLQQIHLNGTESVLWQSFDYPTNVLLPGMKLGVNHKTGHNWSLVSWMGYSNPGLGPFRLEWEPGRRKLIIKQRGQLCWTSGELGNNGSMHNTYYMIVSNNDESYFTITSSNEEFTRWELLKTGQLLNRNGDESVARADMCYGYNTDGGCQKWEKIPTCRHPGDAFELKEIYVNLNSENFLANSSYAQSDCRDICWKNCSCDGFTDYYDDGTGCMFVYLNFTEGNDFANGGEKFYLLVNSIHHHKGTKKWIWISILIVAALFVICVFILCLALKKRKLSFEEKKRKGMETRNMADLATSNRFYDVRDPEDEFKKRQDLKVFNYSSILSATNDFSNENKLGQGGFGPVYKGILPNGQEIAIKRLSKTSSQGSVEFKNELMLIGEFQHMNLVQLLGYCIHEEERILIYEYMANKSLDFYLFDCNRSKLLDWKMRFNIIEGISQGLLYLHKYSRLKVIHRDLKASNILLDENMNPKISDFGLAKMFTQQESITNTSRIVGTYGYMSPEYAMEGAFSVKSDVYSFGVLILEIVSGKRNTSFYDGDRFLNLIGHAWELWNEDAFLQLMDPSLSESSDLDEVQRCIHIGLLCVEQHANDRPTMSQIISMLTNKNAIVTLPQRPAFYVGRDTFDKEIYSNVFYTDSTKAFTTSIEIESS